MNPIISIYVNYSLLIECIQEGNMFTGAMSRMLFAYLTMRIWTSLLDLLSFFLIQFFRKKKFSFCGHDSHHSPVLYADEEDSHGECCIYVAS